MLLRAAAEGPEAVVLDLPILTQDDYNLMVLEYNNTSAPVPADKMLNQLFEAHVATQPDAMCVQTGDKALTYAEVNVRTNLWTIHSQSMIREKRQPVLHLQGHAYCLGGGRCKACC